MKFVLIFLIGLSSCMMLVNCASSEATSDATTTTTAETTTISDSTQPTTEPAGSSVSAGSTQSPGPTVSQGSTQSTEAPATGGSTPKSDTTVVPSTIEPTTEVADVWAEFDLDCNATEGYCVYKINAPQLDEATFNESNSKYETDENMYLKASSMAAYESSEFYANEVYQSYQLAKEQFKNLTIKLQTLNDTVNAALAEAQNQSEAITEALQNIRTIYSNLTTCYYKQCALATPPPPTTTTPPRRTTPNLCSALNCTYPGYPSGKCSVIGGSPSCQCPGNLDQGANCQQVGCYSTTTALKDGMVPGPFWSPGHTNGTAPTSYSSNLNCVYKISSAQNIKIVAHSFNIDSSTQLKVQGRTIPYTLKDIVKLQNYLNGVIGKKAKSVTISFQTGSVSTSNGPYFIDWDFIN